MTIAKNNPIEPILGKADVAGSLHEDTLVYTIPDIQKGLSVIRHNAEDETSTMKEWKDCIMSMCIDETLSDAAFIADMDMCIEKLKVTRQPIEDKVCNDENHQQLKQELLKSKDGLKELFNTRLPEGKEEVCTCPIDVAERVKRGMWGMGCPDCGKPIKGV